MKDISIFEGIIEFESDIGKFRAHEQNSRILKVYEYENGSWVYHSTLKRRWAGGSATPAQIYHALLKNEKD